MASAFEQLAAWKVKNTFIDWDEEDSEVQKHSCRRVFATCPDLVRAATEPSQDCMEPEAEATPTRWNDMSDSELEPAEEKSPEHACSPSEVHVGSPSSREAGDASVANRSKRRGRGGRSHRGGVARSSAFEVREGMREGERCDPARQQKLWHELQQLLQQQQQQQQLQQKLVRVQTPSQVSQLCTTSFDLEAFRSEVKQALRELRHSSDENGAATRLAQQPMPPTEYQAAELSAMLAEIAQESVPTIRQAGFRLAVGLFSSIPGSWEPTALAAGLLEFVEQASADLLVDVPALPNILKEELLPALAALQDKRLVPEAVRKALLLSA
eukprot:CAMPEP_0204003426 /NCGR_PEP_ID=MMETSP0360-20130528/17639_1 /ASSEMBLY_ACC=CAM_ASM_000342 /TAXON_ID=268821 /ORGANISM="Scrippsiella Hangoei, Strain SHTV-5" /LENGTH=325 /DNA_ID=CAMNT_0050945163 /DNA_START=55 /DNA_END=1032 /DNA_ORIENTATION=-